MTDLTPTIQPNVDQLTADNLRGRSLTIDITSVDVNLTNKDKQFVTIHYKDENGHPYKPSLGMRCVITGIWGKDSKQYVGRSMTVYVDDDVYFGKEKTGGVRISHMSHIDEPKTVMIRKTRGKRIPWTVQPIAVAKPAAISQDKKAEGAEKAKAEILKGIAEAPDSESLRVYIETTKAEIIKRLAAGYPDKHKEIMLAVEAREFTTTEGEF